jgi:hypothetical protein
MTQIAEWGPHVWKLLHSCAERAGSSVLPLDEVRAWVTVLKLTEGVLPCATCRAHYREWRTANPLEDFLGMQGERFKGAIRLWLWRLHDAINKRREGVPHYGFEDLEKYKEVSTTDLNQSYKTLVQILATAVLHRQVNPTVVVDWKRAVGLLRRLIGF